MRPTAVLAALAALTLGACQDPVLVAPGNVPTTTSASSAPAAAGAPEIEKLELPSRMFIGAEFIDVKFTLKTPGTGRLMSYGLSTHLGAKVYPIKDPFTAIPGGKVSMSGLGPLPNVVEAGDKTMDFWVIDGAGRESNHLTGQILIQ